MHATIKFVEDTYKKKKVLAIKPGYIVQVKQKIKEGGKEKIQTFEGIVMQVKKPNELAYSIRVRKVVSSIGVEKIFPVHAPAVESITVLKTSKVRRANLNYLRQLADKKTRAKLKSKEAKDLAFIIPKEEAKMNDDSSTNSPQDEKIDEEVTELEKAPEEDAMKEVVTSTEEMAKEEAGLAEIGTEEHKFIEQQVEDEEKVQAEEVTEGLDKADAEDTKDQQKA